MKNKNLNQTDKQSVRFVNNSSSQPITDSILEAHSQAGIPEKKTDKKDSCPNWSIR